jgi:serine/threonine protein kinase/tetratricopeptide (TPR) repeat protein
MQDASPEMLSLFCGALERPSAEERAAYLDAACGKDVELRARVEALLRAHEQAGGFLREKAEARGPGATTEGPIRDRPVPPIGPYKLLEEIGEGGMGVVWMAEQTEPVRRRVALKVIKPGLGSGQVVARFEAERQALALMDHPSIAKVLDGGATEEGRPYFVMELVKGLPITRYCDERRLTVRERLGLFVSVCQAVQHAHQKGVIHRDLKPSNVLVALYDGKPVPKVIDFGVAKATAEKLTERTLFTGFGAVVGTPEYMSPEQAELNQLDIDTRSDVYSLGVLLYELLTGTTPLEHRRVKGADLLEVLRLVREEEPPTPSARLSTAAELPAVAAQRGVEPKKLRGLVRGELDWVVMKCLEKDRDRRYQTASGLALDLGRYLTDEPVQACPPSVGYRVRKFVRRHRLALGTAALLGLTLLAAVGGVSGSVGWAMRDRATRQAAREQEVAATLAEAETRYGEDKLTEALAAAKRAEGLLAGGGSEGLARDARRWRTDLEMVFRLEEVRLGRSAVKGGQYDRAGADPAYRSAFQDYGLDVEGVGPDEAAARVRAAVICDRLVAALDDWARSKPPADLAGREKLLAVLRRADDDPWRNRFRDAYGRRDPKALAALAGDRDTPAQPPLTQELLGVTLDQLGENPLAVEVLRQAQRRYPGDFWINHDLAMSLLHRNQPAARAGEAVGFLRVARALRPDNVAVRSNLGYALLNNGQLAEAEAEVREAVRLGPDFVAAHNILADALSEQGRHREAEDEYRAGLRLQPRNFPGRYGLALALHGQDRLEEARAEVREALRLRPDYAHAHALLGHLCWKLGRPTEAEPHYREALRLGPERVYVHLMRGGFLAGHRRNFDGAVAAFRQALRLLPGCYEAHDGLGGARFAQGNFLAAEAAYQQAVCLRPSYAPARLNLAKVLYRLNKAAEAEAEYREALRLRTETAEYWNSLGSLHCDGKREFDAAATAFRRAVALRPKYYDAHHNLGLALSNGKHWAEAIAAYEAAVRCGPGEANAHGRLAVLLAICPDPKLRDPRRGLEVARRAVELGPPTAGMWRTLGWSEYRAGNWKASVAALEKSMALRKPPGGDPGDWFFLAMAHWKLNNPAEARRWYDRAARWMEQRPRNTAEVLRLQAEAAALLKVAAAPPTKPGAK